MVRACRLPLTSSDRSLAPAVNGEPTSQSAPILSVNSAYRTGNALSPIRPFLALTTDSYLSVGMTV